MFQKLSEIFSDENNYSLSRELLIKVSWKPQRWGGAEGTGDGKWHALGGIGGPWLSDVVRTAMQATTGG